jgi:ribosomal protein S18 acetylase RimI-like enzyme
MRHDGGMADDAIVIRPAVRADLPAMGLLGAALVEVHCALDAQRFMRPGGGLADGYARFLGSQLKNGDAVVLVAEHTAGRPTSIVGYVYAAIEPMSWQDLRDESGFIHDVIVDTAMRGRGVASRLIEGACAWLRERGMPRVLLHTASQNAGAQRLFAALGFRATMVEMMKELR